MEGGAGAAGANAGGGGGRGGGGGAGRGRGRGGRKKRGGGGENRPASAGSGQRPGRGAGAAAAALATVQPGRAVAGAISGQVCLICANDCHFFGVAACEHPVCGQCTLKLKVLYDDKRCTICKADVSKVAVVKGAETRFSSLDFRGLVHDKQWGVYFEEGAYEHYRFLKKITCPECQEQCQNVPALRKHCTAEHQLSYCDICLQNRKVFIHEQVPMTKEQLKAHSVAEHPGCQFCRTLFYNADTLYKHMTDKHETCHICTRRGIQYVYYKDYANLEDHFRKEHLLCEHPECLAKKFMVFADEVEQKAHNLEVHRNEFAKGDRRRMQKIDVNFTVAGSTTVAERSAERRGRGRGGGGAGRPQSAPQAGGGEGRRGHGRGRGGNPHQQNEAAPEPEPEPERDPAPEPEAFPELSPAEVKAKNAAMVSAMRTVLDGDAGKMGEMKRLSQRFRRKELGPEAFLDQMVDLVGLDGLGVFFDDMVALLAINDTERVLAAELRRLFRAKQQGAARQALSRRHFHREPAPVAAAAVPSAETAPPMRQARTGFDDAGGPGPALPMDDESFPGLRAGAAFPGLSSSDRSGGGGGDGGGNLRWTGGGGRGGLYQPGRSSAEDFPSLGGGAPAGGDYPALGGAPPASARGWVGSTPEREDPMSIAALKRRGKKTKKGVVIRIA